MVFESNGNGAVLSLPDFALGQEGRDQGDRDAGKQRCHLVPQNGVRMVLVWCQQSVQELWSASKTRCRTRNKHSHAHTHTRTHTHTHTHTYSHT
jgi:hypothetical protein